MIKRRRFKGRGKGKIASKQTEVNGIVFDSKLEARYYQHLILQPDIEKIEVQPEYILLEPFTIPCTNCKGGGKIPSPKTGKPIQCKKCKGAGERERSGWKYKADFRVTYKTGEIEIIDVKGGFINERFPHVKKLFEYKYRQELIVVKEDGPGWKRG